jgi:hypothetical protein
MKLIEALCTDNPREVTTKYGQRLVIDAIDRATGEKITLWRPANDDYSRQYIIKNSPITVGIDSTGKYSLIENPEMETLGHAIQITKPINRRPIPESSKKPSDCEHFFLSPNEKKEIAAYIATMKDLYGYCLQQADSLHVEGEDRRAIATTLYLSAQKKFAL